MEPLPNKLAHAIDKIMSPLHPDRLRQWCFELTQRYRNGIFSKDQNLRLGYVAARMPATYGVQRHVLRRIEPYLGDIKTILDLGAGPGGFAWAAADAIPRLDRVTMLEKDIEMVRLGQTLGKGLEMPMTWCREDLSNSDILPGHDMVVMSYALNELPPDKKLKILSNAMAAANQLLLIIEPGTPLGFSNILLARKHLIEKGMHVIAPCTHNKPCPLTAAAASGQDWCHFSVRIPRGKYHRRAKAGVLPYEDEKFCYLALSLSPLETPPSRIIREPIKKTGHVIIDVCNENGIERDTVTKSDGEAYKYARDAEWGDPWD